MVAKTQAAKDPNPVSHGTPTEDSTTGEKLEKLPKEPAALAETTDVKHGVAQTPEAKEADKGKEKAAADPNPVKKGVPTNPAPGVLDEPSPTKDDLKRSALFDELEQLKANGNKDPDRLAEIKKELLK